MEVVTFLFFSMLEWFALILLTFAMYRFEVRDSIGQILFASFLLSFFSYTLFNVLDLRQFATLIQPIVVFVFFWQMFKFPVFYAGLCVVNGYLGYCLVVSLLYGILGQFGITVTPSTPTSYVIQSLTAVIVLIIIYVILKNRLGFSFIHQRQLTKVYLSGTNLRLLLLTLVGYTVLTSFNILYSMNHTYIIITLATISFGCLQYWTFKKEYETAYKHRPKKSA